jgi:hypothetical protein
MAVDDGREDTGNVAVRFDFVEFAGLEERREHGPVLGACIMVMVMVMVAKSKNAFRAHFEPHLKLFAPIMCSWRCMPWCKDHESTHASV